MDRPLDLLILEDIDSDAELVELELSRGGIAFRSHRVKTEIDFRRQLKEALPDAVLADYYLPGFSALEALRIVRSERPNLPFILVTGSQTEEIAVECLKRGADDYILKQSLTRLPAALVNALRQREAGLKRAEAEEALRQSEERFRLLFAKSPLPTLVYDDQARRFLEANVAASLNYGFSRDEFLSMGVRDILAKPNGDVIEGFKKYRCKDGRMVDTYVIAQPLEFSGRTASLLIAEDISERLRAEQRLKESHEQLRALSSHLQSIREEERTRIAREIHDELGQTLTALRMDLVWIQGKLPETGQHPPAPVLQTIESMAHIIDTTILTVRRIATELRPGVLDDLGLVSAIEWQAHEFSLRTGIACRVTAAFQEITLDRDRSTALFRILQEALTNVARHAGASKVTIALDRVEHDVVLEVRDNGVGIPESRIHHRTSLGLLGIRERALMLGGVVTISGMRIGGTKLNVSIPMESTAQHLSPEHEGGRPTVH